MVLSTRHDLNRRGRCSLATQPTGVRLLLQPMASAFSVRTSCRKIRFLRDCANRRHDQAPGLCTPGISSFQFGMSKIFESARLTHVMDQINLSGASSSRTPRYEHPHCYLGQPPRPMSAPRKLKPTRCIAKKATFRFPKPTAAHPVPNARFSSQLQKN